MTAKFYPAFLFPLGIYLSAIKTLICHTTIRLMGSASFGFAQNTLRDFQNMVLNS